jgi:hypothetical protein
MFGTLFLRNSIDRLLGIILQKSLSFKFSSVFPAVKGVQHHATGNLWVANGRNKV